MTEYEYKTTSTNLDYYETRSNGNFRSTMDPIPEVIPPNNEAAWELVSTTCNIHKIYYTWRRLL